MQREITDVTKLLKADGSLNEPGYCKRNLYEYNREDISACKLRIKEWDFYQISDGKRCVQINFANISIASAGTIGFFDMETGKRKSAIGLDLGTVKRFQMPRNGDRPNELRYKKGKFSLEIITTETEKHFTCSAEGIRCEFTAEIPQDSESITIATPFEKKNRFFYTMKKNCMPTSGYIEFDGERYEFSKDDTYTVLDWGRGVWPYSNHWYWGNGSTRLPDGKLFGFEITWGFGDESNATETMLFYDNKAHKIGKVWVDPAPQGRYMEDWHFHSEDGRFELTMKPFYDNHSGAVFILGMATHQVHGLWSGKVVLDDGTVLEIKDMYAFCEYVENKW